MVSLLVFLDLDAPGDVLLPDNGQGWEPRHAVERERERERTGWSARVFQMRVRGWWSHHLIILQSDQTLSNNIDWPVNTPDSTLTLRQQLNLAFSLQLSSQLFWKTSQARTEAKTCETGASLVTKVNNPRKRLHPLSSHN